MSGNPEKSGTRQVFSEPMSQYSTFLLGERLYGVDVVQVQEVTRSMPMSPVPLAPSYVHGLINLRGQIATAISLRDLFGLESPPAEEQMNVVCNIDGTLIAFLVDRIGDVMEVSQRDYEAAPDTIPNSVRRFMVGVYKLPQEILSIVDIKTILATVNNVEKGTV